MAFSLDGKLKLDARDFVQGAGKAKKAVGDVGDEFGKLPREAGKAADGVEDELDAIPQSSGKIGDLAGGKLGSALVAGFAAVGVGAILQQSIQTAIADDRIDRDLRGRFDLTAQEAGRFGRIAGDLYVDGWGAGLDEVGNAVAKASRQLEVDTDSALKGISAGVLATSQTFGEDFDAVIRSTSQLMENDLAPSAEAALDLIVGAFQNGGNEAGDLLDTIDEYAQHWEAMGLSGEDALNQVIHGLQNGQRDADKMADAVKEMRLRVVENSELVREALENIGLNADQVIDAFIQGGPAARDAFLEVVGALKEGQENGDDTADAVAIIGTQFEDLGPKALDSLLAIDGGLDDTEGKAAELAETVKATEFETFQRRAERSLAPIGEAVLFLGNDFLAFQEKVGSAGDSFGELIGISKNWEAELTDDIESVDKFVEDFDDTMLDSLSTFDDVHDAVKDQAKAVLSDKDALRAANEITVKWAKKNEDAETKVRAHGAALGTLDMELGMIRSNAPIAAAGIREIGNEAQTTANKTRNFKDEFARMSGQLSDRSAYLDVQDGFADIRAELEETGTLSERTSMSMQQDLIDYVSELDNIDPRVVTNIVAQIDNGSLVNAEAALARLERNRQANLTIRVRAVDSRGNATSIAFGTGATAVVALADGTDFHQGGLALVGEKGPELVNLPRGSQVTPAQETAAMLARPVGASRTVGGGTSIALTVHAGMGADGHAIGSTIVDHLESFYRSGGAPPTSAVA